jgi:PAS domain S-box-containing protein
LVEAIVRTIREPLLILDEQLNVRAASPAFYRTFQANAADTVGHALFELGDGQWDIAALRELLEVTMPLEASVEDFEVALDSPHLGRQLMVLNARRLEGKAQRLILLAIQDVTEPVVTNEELDPQEPLRTEASDTRLVINSRDVTGLCAARDDAAATTRRLKRTVGALEDAVFTVEIPGRTIVDSNPAAERIFGYSSEEMVGRSTLFLHVDEESYRRFDEGGTPALDSGGSYHTEFRMKRKDGTVFPVEITVSLLDPMPGLDAGAVSVIRDITERVERTRRLTFQAELLEAVGQAVIATDLQGRIIYWNGAAEELYGWTRDEAAGESILDVIPSEKGREQATEIMEALREGSAWTGTLEVRRRDGSTFHALVTDAPMRDELGELIGIIGVSSDISDRVALEERLRQAQKMEAVGRLAAGVAHDFNNLLTAIEGHASILLAEIADDDRLRDDVEEIRSAGQRAASLTRQLLAFSRKQKLEERRIDLVSAARDLESMLVRLVPERIDFRVEAGTGEIVVRADPGQLQQVMINLVVNAVDAIDDNGNITVSIDAMDVTSAVAEEIPWEIEVGPYARVTVRDTGHGMDPEVLSRIFEPFFTTKAEGQGTGLGLAMVYGVVKQSGGHVLVDSARGRGTTFEVLLPRLAGETVDTTEPVAGRSRSTEGVVVLLVEDDAAVRKVANRILSRAGCVVLEASNGLEALEIADRYHGTIDVVFSDVVMPDMGGVEMQRRLKTGHPGLRVVLTSGYSESEVHGEIRELGATFVPKPYSPDTLLSSIAQELKRGP